MRPGSWVAASEEACGQQERPLSHRGRAVTAKERDAVIEKKKTKEGM